MPKSKITCARQIMYESALAQTINALKVIRKDPSKTVERNALKNIIKEYRIILEHYGIINTHEYCTSCGANVIEGSCTNKMCMLCEK